MASFLLKTIIKKVGDILMPIENDYSDMIN